MAVPNIFATATSSIPLSQLDTNFATAITLGSTGLYLGNTTTSVAGLTLTGSAFNGTVGATTPSTGAFTTLSASDQIAGNNTASYQAIFKGWGPLESNATAGAIVVGGSSQNSGRGEIHYWNNSSPEPALYIDNTRNAASGKVVVRLKTSATAVEAATFNIYGIGLTGATPSSGTGITFPATQSASTDANTLDDYEEGTWTPTLTFGGVAHNGTYSYQSAHYTKVGRLVTVTGLVGINSAGTATGTARMTSLPFTAMNQTGNAEVMGLFSGFTGLTGTALFGDGPTNNTTVTFYTSAGTATAVDKTNYSTGGANYLEFTFSYFST